MSAGSAGVYGPSAPAARLGGGVATAVASAGLTDPCGERVCARGTTHVPDCPAAATAGSPEGDVSRMPKLGMEPVRRRQMIDATIRTIHEVGFPRTSLAQVARRAGVSQGLVAHYFRDKGGLLEATMRHIAAELKAEVVQHRRGLRDPCARLDAVLEANFSERSFAPESLSAWVAFWGQTHRNPQLGRIQRVLRVRLKSNLAYDLRQLLPDAEARRIAPGPVDLHRRAQPAHRDGRTRPRPADRARLRVRLSRHRTRQERRHTGAQPCSPRMI